jgi:Asp-tRNA(Asn)/Glu-tRNA(Gln) amidotransferase A subunit family amidase
MDWASASEIARAVSNGERSAISITEAALARIGRLNPKLNAFTGVIAKRARAKARAVDSARSEGKPLGPLVGVPFAVKNLFDVAGLATLAGSKINRDHKPAMRDATLVERLEAAGAVLSVRSTWANTPTTSPARTCTTAPRAIRTISSA